MEPLSTARHLLSFARFQAARAGRERNDAETQAALSEAVLPLPAGLELEWLGTAGYRITYQGSTLLIDPYLTRVPLGAVLSRTPALPDPSRYARVLGERTGSVAGIVVGHTHFDHAIDVPALCASLDTQAYGSASLARLMGLHGLAGRAVEVRPRHRYELGPFTVEFFPSRHSKLLLGHRVPFDGELTCEHLDGLSPSAYRCGAIFGIRIHVAGLTLYHQGSANLIDDDVPSGGVDVFLAGIAGRSFTDHYWRRILPRLDPSVVLANHYDDFFRPLHDPMGFSTNVNLTALPDEIARVSREVAVATLPLLTARYG